MRTAAEFRQLTALPEDTRIRSQLVSFLTCLGGNNLDDFVKRIFFALSEDGISLHVNFKGRKLKDSLSHSEVRKVILGNYAIKRVPLSTFVGVFGAWNANVAAKLSDLKSVYTKRLKSPLGNYVQRRQKDSNKTNWTGE
ncbi:hypothetical protein SprV_0100296600 [Sparganum proliferum]